VYTIILFIYLMNESLFYAAPEKRQRTPSAYNRFIK